MRLAILVLPLFHLSVNAQTVDPYFSVTSGESYCEITDNGQCFQNTNYNEQTKYDSSSRSCTIKVLRSTSIKQHGKFELEAEAYPGAGCSEEYLKIKGTKHCGSSPPLEDWIERSTYIYFSLDGDGKSYTGFRFCSSSCSTCTSSPSSSSTSSGNQDAPSSSTGKQDCATYGAAGKPFDCGADSQFKNNTCTYKCRDTDCCEDIPVDMSLPKDLGSSMLVVSLVSLVFVCLLWLLCMYCHSGNKAIYTNEPMKNVQLGQVGQI